MKVVSLVSGGKDSCYNMVLCQHFGHEVVALANLLPEQAAKDDLDSYMYQTVGHQVVAAYAQCMGLPLYRRRIVGTSRQQALVYEDTDGDEVEDLYALLAYVQQRHPGLQAVASGAIASDYQRTRVERVCARLGLVSLAYLWHQPQAALLQRMISAPIDAILVKIAAAGLTPRKHLGAALAALPAQLHALRWQYGINVCGEGGEYETLTLDCPLFTHGRIVLDSWEAVTVSDDSLAPVALLHPTAFHVERKQRVSAAAEEWAAGTSGAVVTCCVVEEVPLDFQQPQAAAPASAGTATTVDTTSPADEHTGLQARLSITDSSQFVTLVAEIPEPCSSSAATAGTSFDPRSAQGTAAALAAALQLVDAALPALGLGWQHSVFAHLYVPSMAQFAAANAAYARFFPPVNPPSRATVELGVNAELALVVEVLFARAEALRRVLHVQSISEWAPSCIGPYSQALQHAGLVYFAGQIGLHPPTMEVLGGGLDRQCVRCLASCQAVAVAMRTDLPRSMLWCTVYCSEAAGPEGWARVRAHLDAFLLGRLDTTLLQQGDPEAAGRLQLGNRGSTVEEYSVSEEEEDGEEEVEELDEYLRPPPMRRHWQPLVTFVTVPQLPRGVMVEIQPVACVVDATSAEDSSSSDSDDEAHCSAEQRRQPPYASCMPGWIGRLEQQQHGDAAALCSPGRLCRAHASVSGGEAVMGRTARAAGDLKQALAAAQLLPADLVSVKAYCQASLLGGKLSVAHMQHCVCEALGSSTAAVTVVPVTAAGVGTGSESCVILELLAVRHT